MRFPIRGIPYICTVDDYPSLKSSISWKDSHMDLEDDNIPSLVVSEATGTRAHNIFYELRPNQ